MRRRLVGAIENYTLTDNATTMPRASRPGRIRIIGGKWRGRFVEVPNVAGLRPTPNRVRETVFNWLAPEIEGARVLDLYAGTGALGIEALSRGALSATFVESGQPLAAALRSQLERLGAQANVVCRNVQEYLDGTAEHFDLIFADPPFEMDVQHVCATVGSHLRQGGAFYCERAAADDLPAIEWGEWQRRSVAGDVVFGIARATA